MSDRYGLLHYRGDQTAQVIKGQILGGDEFGCPFAVLDAEYDPEADVTTLHLQYATPEQYKPHTETWGAQVAALVEQRQRLAAAGLVSS